MKSYINRLKNNYLFLVVYGFILRAAFSLIGHNFDWPNYVRHIGWLRNFQNVYDLEKHYPYFPTRYYIELPIFNFMDRFNLESYGFIDLKRIFYIFVFYTLQIVFLNYFKQYLPEKLFLYVHYSPVLSFASGFMNQMDLFVLIISTCLLFGFTNESKASVNFAYGFLFFIFSSMKPIIAPIVGLLFFVVKVKKIIPFYLGIAISAILNIYYIFFTHHIFPDYNLFWTMRSILSYEGFNNFPFFSLLGLISYDIEINFRLLSFLCFLLFIIYNLNKSNKVDIQLLIYIYLISSFIFAPTLAQQNLAILFFAINIYYIDEYKNRLLFLDVATVCYLILLNFQSIFDNTLKNLDYLLWDLYFFLDYHSFLFVPNERYFGNFVMVAIIYYFSSKKKIFK